jgi:hypothetical protein
LGMGLWGGEVVLGKWLCKGREWAAVLGQGFGRDEQMIGWLAKCSMNTSGTARGAAPAGSKNTAPGTTTAFSPPLCPADLVDGSRGPLLRLLVHV